MKRTVVGGPLLGAALPSDESGRTFAPVIVSAAGGDRYILLPRPDSITVLSHKTGSRIGTLVVPDTEDDSSLTTLRRICSVVVTTHLQHQFILVGCSDGSIQQFALDTSGGNSDHDRVARHHCSFKIASEKYSVTHLAVTPTADGTLVYALLSKNKSKRGMMAASLVHVVLPLDAKAEGTIDVKGKLVQIDSFKFGTEDSPVPFSLQVTPAPARGADNSSVFCILASATALTLYYDSNALSSSKQSVRKVELDTVFTEPLTSCQVHGSDIACGHYSGAIRVLHNVLTTAEEYCESKKYKKPKSLRKNTNQRHPVASNLLIRKIHWHAHAVASMAYDATGTLYTGGDESVLVTWQLQRGVYKPANVLPRIAVGGILHVVYADGSSATTRGDADAVLVACSDNSLQLFESHSKNLLWKYQGLAAVGPAMLPDHVPSMTVTNDTTVIVSGLASAPGSIQWYDAGKQAVVQQLDVVPFNRVSRTERGDSSPPMPTPAITHAMFRGKDLVTVDVVPTENVSVGAVLEDSKCGSVTSIRFWTKTVSSSYELTASMTYPHGMRNRVSALALADDGKYAVTVSNDEGAFRLWRRGNRPDEVDHKSKRTDHSEWVCRCKVTIPSGYSNFDTGSAAVAFSPDASVLAIAFGPFVTLWDHNEVTLLTALRHGDNTDDVVGSVQFLQSDRLADGMILIKSKTCVALRSPYGHRGPAGIDWNWVLPANEVKTKSGRVSRVEFLPTEELVAIAQYCEAKDASRVLLVDAISGELCRTLRGVAVPVIDDISGEIVSLAAADRNTRGDAWVGDGGSSSIVCLYALTSKGEMVCLGNSEMQARSLKALFVDSGPEVPTLPLLASAETESSKKRKLSVLDVADLEEAPTQMLSLEHFGSITGEDNGPIPTFQLPLLRGAFSRAFMKRHIQRRDDGQ